MRILKLLSYERRHVVTGIVAAILVSFGWIGGLEAAAAPRWTLALTWHPGFCATTARAPDCRSQRASPYGLVLHGLWPEGAGEYCARDAAASRGERWCSLPRLTLAPDVDGQVAAVMPGRAACLDRHEWQKHGTCSGLSPDAYFSLATGMTRRVAELAIGRLLSARVGQSVTLPELRAALAEDFGPRSMAALTAVCAQRGESVFLTELRLSLSDQAERFPAAEALAIPPRTPRQRCPVNQPVSLGPATAR